MRDVASTAGVSLKTVSRVVNGEAGVSPATAARVAAAIARLGFARNDLARSLRHGRAGAVGLVIEDVANPFYSAIARVVEDAAHARGHILITGSCEEDPERERQLVQRLLRRLVDALIIVPAGEDPALERGSHDAAGAERAVRDLLALPADRRPTALFCANNRNTVGALRALRDHDEPVALVGFDDFELADMLSVPITVVRHEAEELGRLAVELAYARLAGDDGLPRRLVIPCDMVIRGSGEVPA